MYWQISTHPSVSLLILNFPIAWPGNIQSGWYAQWHGILGNSSAPGNTSFDLRRVSVPPREANCSDSAPTATESGTGQRVKIMRALAHRIERGLGMIASCFREHGWNWFVQYNPATLKCCITSAKGQVAQNMFLPRFQFLPQLVQDTLRSHFSHCSGETVLGKITLSRSTVLLHV